MKKIIALALSLMLILCAAAALAGETAEKADLGTLDAFKIRGVIPEGYTYSCSSTGMSLIGNLECEGKASITVSIFYNEEYTGVERFNDVDEATVEAVKNSFLFMDDVAFEDLETAYGTRLLKVTQADKAFADIYTVYKGYELEFIVHAEEEVTEDDIRLLVDFISDMDFIPAN